MEITKYLFNPAKRHNNLKYCELDMNKATEAMKTMETMEMLMDGKEHKMEVDGKEAVVTLGMPWTYYGLFLYAYMLGLADGQTQENGQ